MPELVQAFRFRVELSRSLPGRTLTPPPDLAAGDTPAARAGAGGESPGGPQTLGDGGFQECTGLDVEADLKEYLEGGANDTVVRRVGRLKVATLVLKRGMVVPTQEGVADTSLWDWLHAMVSGVLPVPRYDGVIEVYDAANTRSVARWTFTRGLPLKVVGPALHAATGAIAIEELHIQHEGLRLETAA